MFARIKPFDPSPVSIHVVRFLSNRFTIDRYQDVSWNICNRYLDLHRCTVHFAESFNQHINRCTYTKLFTLKHLKLLQHISIFLDHPQGATLFLAKITFLKIHSLIDFLTLI